MLVLYEVLTWPWFWPVAALMALAAWLGVLGDWMEVTLWPEI